MQPNSRRVITRDKYDAVLLDLDVECAPGAGQFEV